MRILLSGEGGQGIQTIAKIFSQSLFRSGYRICYMPHYGVEMRMGVSLAYLRLDEEIIDPKFSRADIILVMASRDLERIQEFVDKKTTVINLLDISPYLVENKLAAKTANILALAIIINNLRLFNFKIDDNLVKGLIAEELGQKKNLAANLRAYDLGLKIDHQYYNKSLLDIHDNDWPAIIHSDSKKDYIQFPHLCKSCGICLEHCPVKALSWSKDKFSYISRPLPQVEMSKCLACGICEEVCPDCAVRVEKK